MSVSVSSCTLRRQARVNKKRTERKQVHESGSRYSGRPNRVVRFLREVDERIVLGSDLVPVCDRQDRRCGKSSSFSGDQSICEMKMVGTGGEPFAVPPEARRVR